MSYRPMVSRRDGGAGDYAHPPHPLQHPHQQGGVAADGRYVDPRHAGMPPQQGAYGSHAASVGPRSGEYEVSVRLEEIEILRNRLENLEQDYKKLQNENGRLEAVFEAYKSAESERELQVNHYKQHVEKLSNQLKLLNKRAAQASELEKELNKVKSELQAKEGGLGGSGDNGAGAAAEASKSMSTALANMSGQVDALIEEVDVISQSFEETQQTNAKLLEQLTEQSNCQVKLRVQLLKQEKDLASMKGEMVRHEDSFVEEKRLHKKKEHELRETEKKYNKMELQWRRCMENLQEKETTCRGLEEGRADLQQKVASLQKELEIQKAAASASASEKKRKLEGGTSVHGGSDQQAKEDSRKILILQSQVDEYKKYVLCPICNDRHKAMIITRCLHMFCDHCINTMVASRSRKCPACGEKFSQSELRQLYWT